VVRAAVAANTGSLFSGAVLAPESHLGGAYPRSAMSRVTNPERHRRHRRAATRRTRSANKGSANILNVFPNASDPPTRDPPTF
jgi:hypothetical protein